MGDGEGLGVLVGVRVGRAVGSEGGVASGVALEGASVGEAVGMAAGFLVAVAVEEQAITTNSSATRKTHLVDKERMVTDPSRWGCPTAWAEADLRRAP